MKKKIVIAGGTGLLGQGLIEMLDKDRYEIHVLTRSDIKGKGTINYIQWDTSSQHIDLDQIEGTDIIVNLAGAGIADKRWTKERKKLILDSRKAATETLAKAVTNMKKKPELFIGASAIGYYGDRGNEVLTEESSSGSNFLADVCVDWEASTRHAAIECSRSITMRIGIVLSSKGGALAEILKTTVTGIYGYFGNGQAYYSWIHIDDLCRMFIKAIEDKSWDGIYNGTAETPITIKQLVKAVKAAKGGIGPLVPVPAFALRLGMGEMADMLLASMRVVPSRALSDGFKFKYRDAENAIKDILAREV